MLPKYLNLAPDGASSDHFQDIKSVVSANFKGISHLIPKYYPVPRKQIS